MIHVTPISVHIALLVGARLDSPKLAIIGYYGAHAR
jgi:hypothetical protein